MRPGTSPHALFLSAGLLLVLGGCSTAYIPGTRITDSPENREVLDLIERYRQALENRDADTIVSLCSPRYFEDMGTPDQNDDYGYPQLADKVIKDSFKHCDQLFISITIDDIRVEEEQAAVDVRFDYRAHLTFPAGDKWVSDTEFNRIELAREAGVYKFMSGL